MTMVIVAVPPDRVEEAWPLAEKYVKDAEEKTGYVEVEDVHLRLILGQALLWLIADGTNVVGAGVTKIVQTKKEKFCEIFVGAADDMKKCFPLMQTIYDFAKAEGCAKVRLLGRRGWARMLPDYRMPAVILEKAI